MTARVTGYLAEIHGLLGKIGFRDRPLKLAAVSLLVGYRVDSTKDLTVTEMRQLLDELGKLRRGPGDGREKLKAKAAILAAITRGRRR